MATKKTSKSSVSKKGVLVTKKKSPATKAKTKKKFSPGLKNRPKFSALLLVVLVFVLTGGGVYYIYNSFAATTETGDPEPAFEAEVSEGSTAANDPQEVAKTGAITASGEKVNKNAFGTSTPWRTSTSKSVYNNSKYWKSASTTARSTCSLGSFTAISKKVLPIAKHQIQFKNNNPTNVNYFVMIPDYKINGSAPRYVNFEEHIPGFYTRSNESVKYTFDGSSKSKSQGYTSYVARLSGYYLYKTMTLRPGTTPAVWDYKLYRIKCGAKTVSNIKATRPVNGALLKDKAVSQIGNKEDGVNCGAQIKKYLTFTGMGCGAQSPWCAAFVSWVFGNTSLGLESKVELRQTGADSMIARLERADFKKYVNVKSINCGNYDLSPGDILFRRPGQSDGHVGMVRSYSNGVLKTIEGNASDMVKQNVYKGGEICRDWNYFADWRKW